MTDTTTVIGRGCTFKGELVISGACRVLGTLEGSIRAEPAPGEDAPSEVRIEGSSATNARIEADRVVVEGVLSGDVVARTSLHLGRDARVKGDVIAGALSVSEGASFEGRVCVGPDAVRTFSPAPASPERRPLPEVVVPASKPAAARHAPAGASLSPAAAGTDDWLADALKTTRAESIRWNGGVNGGVNGGGSVAP
ncbi:MAG: polymer-forming cytoskeletal protein [Planctomycetota bacterium]|nr:polymer-forming cytoskeletal protein [Planctomycetota bacterium]